jgi:YggT family protein
MTESSLQQNQELKLHEHERSVTAANQNSSVGRIVYIVYFLFSVLELLLGLRIVLHVVGANAENGFANFVYVLTASFVALFGSLLTNPVLSPTATLEITTMLAMLAYAILAWLLGRVIWLTLSRPR